jgi:hypothetical protein
MRRQGSDTGAAENAMKPQNTTHFAKWPRKRAPERPLARFTSALPSRSVERQTYRLKKDTPLGIGMSDQFTTKLTGL